MDQSGLRQTIQPYYKEGNVFERDQAYYTQMLNGTRRIANNLQGSVRQSSLQRSRSNLGVGQQSRISPANRQTDTQIIGGNQSRYLNASNANNALNYNSSINYQQSSNQYQQALSQNTKLKQEMEGLMQNKDFGNSSSVVILQHYSQGHQQSALLKEQEQKIKRLEEVLRSNQTTINNYKNAANELSLRMNNIQSIDKQIYKILQGSTNRDRQLLDRASSALARGQRREDIAKILQQIIT